MKTRRKSDLGRRSKGTGLQKGRVGASEKHTVLHPGGRGGSCWSGGQGTDPAGFWVWQRPVSYCWEKAQYEEQVKKSPQIPAGAKSRDGACLINPSSSPHLSLQLLADWETEPPEKHKEVPCYVNPKGHHRFKIPRDTNVSQTAYASLQNSLIP